MQNKVRFRIGEIEFEAEGDAEVIARERNEFVSTLLPLAVEAMVRTTSVAQTTPLVSNERYEALPESDSLQDLESLVIDADLSRISLAEFVMQKGATAHNDFIICAAYFDEKKNGVLNFSLENVKKYYEEARKKSTSNPSQYLNSLATKGFIVDSPEHKGEIPKVYKLSNSGLTYVETLQPKEGKEKKTTSKPRKSRPKAESTYASINTDELNLQNYPTVKSLKDFKEKMLMVLYIVTNENKGVWFSVADVLCLMTDVFGEAATKDQVNGVFKREKLWFKSENIEGNNKEKRRKLLNAGSDFAKGLFSTIT